MRFTGPISCFVGVVFALLSCWPQASMAQNKRERIEALRQVFVIEDMQWGRTEHLTPGFDGLNLVLGLLVMSSALLLEDASRSEEILLGAGGAVMVTVGVIGFTISPEEEDFNTMQMRTIGVYAGGASVLFTSSLASELGELGLNGRGLKALFGSGMALSLVLTLDGLFHPYPPLQRLRGHTRTLTASDAATDLAEGEVRLIEDDLRAFSRPHTHHLLALPITLGGVTLIGVELVSPSTVGLERGFNFGMGGLLAGLGIFGPMMQSPFEAYQERLSVGVLPNGIALQGRF